MRMPFDILIITSIEHVTFVMIKVSYSILMHMHFNCSLRVVCYRKCIELVTSNWVVLQWNNSKALLKDKNDFKGPSPGKIKKNPLPEKNEDLYWFENNNIPNGFWNDLGHDYEIPKFLVLPSRLYHTLVWHSQFESGSAFLSMAQHL